MASNAAPPPIRTTKDNAVPRCVTPARLMAFLKQRNHNLDPRFVGIADWYRRHGDTWHVRWDYAFYQMAVETNFLTYKQGNGRWGDVRLTQNNFAGLGTTGGGVPGDSYPDVSTGVLAQIQHLVVYSGEHIPAPVGARTKLKQDDIIESVASFGHPTTFSDLSRRWASDRHYGASIEWVADSYRSAFCSKADETPAPRLVVKPGTKSASATKKRVAEAELPPAAALGGPADAADNVPVANRTEDLPEPVVEPVADASASNAMPVRTVWSRSIDAAPGADLQTTQSLPSSAAPARAPDEDGPPVLLAQVPTAKPVSREAEQLQSAEAKVAEPPIAPAKAAEPEQEIATQDAGGDNGSAPQASEPATTAPVAAEQTVPEPEPKLAESNSPSPPATDTPGSPTPAASQSAPPAPDANPAPTEPSAPPPPTAPVAPPAPRELAQAPDSAPTAAPETAKDTSFKFAAAMDVQALTAPPAPEQVAAAKRCRIMSASYGGKKTILVLARQDGEARYTALTVLDGFEGSMLDNFVKLHAPGGASIGEFDTREAALAKAKQMCRGSARNTARAG